MKLRLFSLALVGVALLNVVQADATVAASKREAVEEEEKGIKIDSDSSTCACLNGECKRCDENGCTQVPNCMSKREAAAAQAVEGKEIMDRFEAQTANCKCLRRGQCEKRFNNVYHPVHDCGERATYLHCDANGCRYVTDGQCKCEYGRCERCYADGCVQIEQCDNMAPLKVKATDCQVCRPGGCTSVGCSFEVQMNGGSWETVECSKFAAKDIMLQDKCTCESGKCKLCRNEICQYVNKCERYATCTCDMATNSDRRCYGYKGSHRWGPTCTTMGTCTAEQAERAIKIDQFLNRMGRPKRAACDCPSDGGLCKQCDFLGRCSYVKECGPVAKRDSVAIEREADRAVDREVDLL